MKNFKLSLFLAAFCCVNVRAQYGKDADYGGFDGKVDDVGFGGGVKNDLPYGGGKEIGKGPLVPPVAPPVGGKGIYDKPLLPPILPKGPIGGIKPGIIKPGYGPIAKPVLKSYVKVPKIPYGGGYGGGYGSGYGGGYGYGGGFGSYGGGYGKGFGGIYGGKVVPIQTLHKYGPQLDITQFIKPYEGAHILQKYGKPEEVFKRAPPVYITQPVIKKTIYQDVFVKQPVLIEKQPVIHKEKDIQINKKPPIVKFNEKAPVDVKDFGETAVVKPVLKEPPFEKDIGIKDIEPIGALRSKKI